MDIASEERILYNPDMAYNAPMFVRFFGKNVKTKEDVALCEVRKWVDISSPGGPSLLPLLLFL